MELDSEPGAGNAFTRVWREAFGKTPALGHILRREFHGNWTRFHALPGSKRYAETESEHEIILSRANALGAELFEDGESIWLVTTPCGRFFELDGKTVELVPAPLYDLEIESADLVSRLNMDRAFSWIDADDQIQYLFYAARIAWKPFSLDWLFIDIAHDQNRALMFSEARKTAFAPYDGGFDIVSLQPDRIRYLEAKFGPWMSERPDKL